MNNTRKKQIYNPYLPSYENIAEWTTVTIPVRISGGVYPVYFGFRGEGKMDLLEFTLE